MGKYIKFMKIMLIAIGVLLIIRSGIAVSRMVSDSAAVSERTNTECITEERVFDYADKLTDTQEEKLRQLIAKREKQIQADIVLVTLQEGLSESELMKYSDDMQDEMKFGYNAPYENCVILVDDWTSKYMWLHTGGSVLKKYDTGLVNYVLDKTCEYVSTSPYKGYQAYVNNVYKTMRGSGFFKTYIPNAAFFLIALIVTIVFLLINLLKKGAKKTTEAATYMKNHKFEVLASSDMFLTKSVTKRRIESSSGGSGGGGSHSSGGGNSYGGGGRSH